MVADQSKGSFEVMPSYEANVCIVAVIQQMQTENAPLGKINEYTARVDRNLSLWRRRKFADQYTQKPVFFSWDIPRTREGYYHYQAGLPAATKRAIEFAPCADLLWLETADPSVKVSDLRSKTT